MPKPRKKRYRAGESYFPPKPPKFSQKAPKKLVSVLLSPWMRRLLWLYFWFAVLSAIALVFLMFLVMWL